MGNIGVSLPTFTIILSIYLLGWLIIWYAIEWRFRVLCEHNSKKVPNQVGSLLKIIERRTIITVRCLMLLTLAGSIAILSILMK